MKVSPVVKSGPMVKELEAGEVFIYDGSFFMKIQHHSDRLVPTTGFQHAVMLTNGAIWLIAELQQVEVIDGKFVPYAE